ncbi:MAG TPA: hypothetical protein VN678_01015 [Acidobacteriaceae bacterium]|nr:hypothetical protein [Acidobacteriaceae bacterium]
MALSASGILLLGILAHPGSSASHRPSADTAGATGSVCILPNSPERPTRVSPGGDYNPNTLTVRIDGRKAIRWPHKAPAVIDGLEMRDTHLIVLTSEGRRIMSARFRFSEYHDARLCADFDGYQGIRIGNRSDALWCKVKRRTCWP